MKKSILFLHTTLDVGGAEKMRMTLLRNLDRDRYDIKICCIGRKGEIGARIEAMGYRVDELSEDPRSLNIRITLKLIRYIKKEKPRILHSSLFNANFHARLSALFCRVPCVITEEHGEHKQYKGVKFLPYRAADFLLSGLTDFIICCSEELRRDIIKSEYLSPRRVVSVENCLDSAMYEVSAGREDIRRRHGLSKEFVFIVTGSLKAGKGHDCLIDALKDVKSLGHDFRCFFAGGGPFEERLRVKCGRLGLDKEIIFLGNVGNIADYLSASDVFVLPSFSEGFSLALMEAMLFGLPCIVTDVGGNARLIKDGFNGTVVPPGDREGVRDAVIFYCRERGLSRERGARSVSIIKERHSSPDKYAERFYEIWDKCAVD
ncbi:MAG: glycosyltransferase [Candidatus Omnitrophota bacterium]